MSGSWFYAFFPIMNKVDDVLIPYELRNQQLFPNVIIKIDNNAVLQYYFAVEFKQYVLIAFS